jgi:hypothetical protein
MIRKKAVLFILFLLLQLTGCMAPVEPTALNLTPVSTPTPTSTPTVIPPATPSPSPEQAVTPTVTPLPTPTMTPVLSPVITSSPSPTPSPVPTKRPTSTPTVAAQDYTGICTSLADYLADPANGQLVGEKALSLNGGSWTNACVITVSEALRRLGCDIPYSTDHTTELIKDLTRRGFNKSFDLDALLPGAICFTTNADGRIGSNPTHSFIFLSWSEPGVMNIYDNQVGDYGSQYHTRLVDRYHLADDPDNEKDATAYFFYR